VAHSLGDDVLIEGSGNVELIGSRPDEAKADVVPSSGNVFADLGVQNPTEKQTKVRLAVAINQIIQGRKLSQTAAARRLKLNQPKASALSNYLLDGFSVERVMNFVTARDRDVVIRRKPKSRKIGPIAVTGS
jgi:predicted XRE-type DNA-binding protein